MKQLSVTLLACALMAFSFWHPNTTQTFTGAILDNNSKPIKNAIITAFAGDKAIGTTQSDALGVFTLALPSGKFTFEVSKNNYETLRLLQVQSPLTQYGIAVLRLDSALTQRQIVTQFWSDQTMVQPLSSLDFLEFELGAMCCRFSYTKPFLEGRITDPETKEELIGAGVVISKNGRVVRSIISNIDGRINVPLDTGIYSIKTSYTGYESVFLDTFIVSSNTDTSFTICTVPSKRYYREDHQGFKVSLVKPGSKTAPAVIAAPAAPVEEMNKKLEYVPAALTEEEVVIYEAAPAPVDDAKKATAGKPTPAKPVSKAATKSSSRIAASKEKAADAAKKLRPVSVSAETMEIADIVTTAPEVAQIAPAAGVLTAGEWNDLDNWNNHWADLLKDGEIDAHQTVYGFFPQHRYTVLLHNETGFPIIDQPIALTDATGNTVWEAHTDNTGKAELWYALHEKAAQPAVLYATVLADGQKKVLGEVKPCEKGLNRFTLQRTCQAPQLLDIMWAVDATGSMGDEIDYLKTELLDVIQRVQRSNNQLTVRMGATFYRDDSDAYLVKSSGFSPDIQSTVAYIKEQSADGGGDMPEAVHSALDEVVYRQKWSDQAVARICFLILDASPHQTPQVTESIRKSIREAARKGIRIVPVSASGIEKDTEFLMKFFGLATNGSYLFLTDHSGVGGKHLEPTSDEYKVEPFNDLLVRIINQYASVATCDGQSLVQFERDPAQKADTIQAAARFFPNPATDILQVLLPVDATKITLYNAEGKAVYSLTNVAQGLHRIPVQGLPGGYYSLRIWANGQVQTGKVLVIKM